MTVGWAYGRTDGQSDPYGTKTIFQKLSFHLSNNLRAPTRKRHKSLDLSPPLPLLSFPLNLSLSLPSSLPQTNLSQPFQIIVSLSMCMLDHVLVCRRVGHIFLAWIFFRVLLF